MNTDTVKEVLSTWFQHSLNPLRDMAMTRRMHIKRVIKEQTVAEHSYHVAMLCWKLCDHEPSEKLLKAALFHDLAESFTGDAPAPIKWLSKVIKGEMDQLEDEFNKFFGLELSLSPKEALVLKWADSLELMWHCVDEMNMGNRNVQDVYDNLLDFVTNKLEPVKNGLQELHKVKTAYAIANTR